VAIVHDTLELALRFPRGEFDVALLLQDRAFAPAGQQRYQPNSTSDTTFVLVNGQISPYMVVYRAVYRLRLLNGAGLRDFTLQLSPPVAMFLIATDAGLLSSPLPITNVTISPGERVEVLVNLTAVPPEGTVTMTNTALGPHGSAPVSPVLQFRLHRYSTAKNVVVFPLPDLSTITSTTGLPMKTGGESPPVRAFALSFDSRMPNIGTHTMSSTSCPTPWLINSQPWDAITELVRIGSTEFWDFSNPTHMPHPMHIHATRLRLVRRTTFPDIHGAVVELPLGFTEHGWKDTINAPANTITRVQVMFSNKYTGRFAYHCHALAHEDHAMMRQFRVFSPVCNHNGVCNLGEDCTGCPEDCVASSFAACGNGLCESGDGESCVTCPQDCARNSLTGFCCGVDQCSKDSICTTTPFHCRESPRTRACCGDGLCEGHENVTTCAVDCSNGGIAPTFAPSKFEPVLEEAYGVSTGRWFARTRILKYMIGVLGSDVLDNSALQAMCASLCARNTGCLGFVVFRIVDSGWRCRWLRSLGASVPWPADVTEARSFVVRAWIPHIAPKTQPHENIGSTFATVLTLSADRESCEYACEQLPICHAVWWPASNPNQCFLQQQANP
jgi:hypothetical protein